jgi:ketosteroid isomerase-like protein
MATPTAPDTALSNAELAARYLDAIGRHDFEALADLLHPDLEFVGPFVTLHSAPEYVAAYRRLALVLTGTVLRKSFVDGDDVCVIYEFVTDTPAGAVTFIEWMTVEDGRIRSIRLTFDRVEFEPARAELFRRAAARTPNQG